jgi:hypothetical protein
VKYANGWLGVAYGQLEYLDNSIRSLRDEARRTGNDPDNFSIVLLSQPVLSSSGASSGQRLAMTGTVEEIGTDLKRIKEIGVDQVILGYNFSPEGKSVERTIEVSKQLARFAR